MLGGALGNRRAGVALQNPGLIAACVVGDGEAETGFSDDADLETRRQSGPELLSRHELVEKDELVEIEETDETNDDDDVQTDP